MNIYYTIGISVFSFAFLFMLYFLLLSHIRAKRRQFFIIEFANYQTATLFYLEKAFDLIYKDRIMVFSIEGTRPDKNEFDQISKDFCKLFLKLLGPTIYEELVHFHGDIDTLILIATEYFNNRSENDEIKESSINSLMEKDNFTEPEQTL